MKNKAFTLMETLIAMTLVLVVITAVSGLILNTILSNQRNIHTLQALYLAQESLEALRFLRDSNWLQNYSWDKWFDLGENSELTLYLQEEACPPCFSLSVNDTAGLIELEAGFKFLRSITLRPIMGEHMGEQDAVELTASVSWQDKGIARSLDLSTYLTDWQ